MEQYEINVKRIALGILICMLAISIYAIPEFILKNVKDGSTAFFGLAAIIILLFGSKILDSSLIKKEP